MLRYRLTAVAHSHWCCARVHYTTNSIGISDQGFRDAFIVAARESGKQRDDLPVWTLRSGIDAKRALGLIDGFVSVRRSQVRDVRGAFQLFDVLREEECLSLISRFESLGFHENVGDHASQLHAANCNVVVPEEVHGLIFDRCRRLLPKVAGLDPLGLNPKFRCFRYNVGGHFVPHTDTAVPETSVSNGKIIHNEYGDRLSQLTFIMMLNSDYEGGETRFYSASKCVATRTPQGGALCFPNGIHPDSSVHEAAPVRTGNKYILRTQVLYSLHALKQSRLPFDAIKLSNVIVLPTTAG